MDVTNKSIEEETQDSKNITCRLGECEVCGSDNAQYTCPRCELKTCSLNCAKIHKKELDCNGDRDKVGFVPLSKFNNLTLLSDYRFLEEVSRTIDTCRRNPYKKYTRFKRPLPPHLHRLKREAFARDINIHFLPQHFTKHQENTTFLHFASKVIYWRIKLIFCQADNLQIVFEKCDENQRIAEILSNLIEYDRCPEEYKKKLKFYIAGGLSNLEVLLKAENVEKQPSFFILEMSSTLKENFEGQTIIEYPILYVIFKSHKDEFTILDPDFKQETFLANSFNGKLDFVPFSYFDTVSYSKKSTPGDTALKNINSYAAELKTYFCCESSEDEEDAEVNKKHPVNTTEKSLNIPIYENLIQQNL